MKKSIFCYGEGGNYGGGIRAVLKSGVRNGKSETAATAIIYHSGKGWGDYRPYYIFVVNYKTPISFYVIAYYSSEFEKY